MRRPGASLRHGLDRDVYQVVRKLLDDENNAPRKISVCTIYDAIKKSNSSLKRKPKLLLEDSIDKILSVLQEEASSNSDDAVEEGGDTTPANVMNRCIVKSWTPKTTPSANWSDSRASVTTIAETAVHATVTADIQSEAIVLVSDVPQNNKRTRSSKNLRSTSDRLAKRNKSNEGIRDANVPGRLTLADIGGMGSVIEQFKEYVLIPLLRPQRYVRRGIKIPRGILLHGPPGCGKTVLCEAVANQIGLPFLRISAPSIVSGMSGESEKTLRQHFENAIQMAPCLMFIDEIDAITPKRESAQREMERRIVGQLLTCMDDLALEKTGKPVIVLAATNRPDGMDPALRRAGRFDTEIHIPVPNPAAREKILRAQTRKTILADDVDFTTLANITSGYVGADLESLVSKAGSAADTRYRQALENMSLLSQASLKSNIAYMDIEDKNTTDELIDNNTTIRAIDEGLDPAVASFMRMQKTLLEEHEPEDFEDEPITMADFQAAFAVVQPSSKREGFATVPETTWDCIGALHAVRKQLHNAIVQPILKPALYERFGISIPAGVLLYGPPGCGKTLLAKAVANESKAAFISIKGPELLNKYVGESERSVRQVFYRARLSMPCVIFFDELDALVPRRDGDSMSEASARVVNTLLTELDGINARTNIYVIAATNRPDMIDPAMLRPGRLGKLIFVGPPGPEERVLIMSTILRGMPLTEPTVMKEFARRCQGFSGADLSNLVNEAASKAVEREAPSLELQDLESAFAEVKPSVGDMKRYERFMVGTTLR